MRLQRRRLILVVIVLVMLSVSPRAQKPAASSSSVAKAVAAANAFLATLSDAQRAKARLDFNEKTRVNWSNLPTGSTLQSGATERNGIKLGDLNAAQQEAALALVAAPLSASGFKKVMHIVAADQVLEDRANRPAGSRIRFGRSEYYVAILGAPSTSSPWMIQFGGHHLAINVTVTGGTNVLTPSHTGTQPATFTLDGQTIRPLGNENDKAFALVNSLDETLRKQAVLGYDVRTTVLGPGLDGKTIQPEGARVSGFSADQKAKLVDLVGEWIGILSDETAAAKLADVKANLGETWFAWSGATTNGSSAYFRVQGPTVLIEYAPQGSTDHIHTFYRDPTNDYGVKAGR